MARRSDEDDAGKGQWLIRCLVSTLAFVVLSVGFALVATAADGHEADFLAFAWTFLALSILPLSGAVGLLASWLWGLTSAR